MDVELVLDAAMSTLLISLVGDFHPPHPLFLVEMENDPESAVLSVEDSMDDMAEVNLDEPEQREVVGDAEEGAAQEGPQEETHDDVATAVDNGDALPQVSDKDDEAVAPSNQSAHDETSSIAEPVIQHEQSSPVTASQPSVDSPPVTRPPSSVFGNHIRTQSSSTLR